MEFLLNIGSTLRNLGKSKRFVSALGELILLFALEAYPNIDPAAAAQLQEYSIMIWFILAGGYSVQDAAKTFRTGETKYDQ